MNLRRKDREVIDNKELIQIIDRCKVCRIAMHDKAGLYIVPMNFGYTHENGRLLMFFHSAKEGRKISALKENNDVCFEMDCEHRLIKAGAACSYGYAYKSIIGNGKVEFVDAIEEKKRALSILMKHQTGQDFSFDDEMVNLVSVFKIVIHSYTGKVHG